MSEPLPLVDRVGRSLLGPCGVSPADRVLVACSGGMDSTVLLDLLVSLQHRLSLDLHVATVDHGLREGSRTEAETVGADCQVLDLSWRRLPVEVTDAEIRRVGPESAARAARYAALEGEADRIGASAIALAHHRDDQAETVLMRALVGAGTRGLAAMRPRSGRRIRPLLGVARTELADHAAGRGLRWTEDPSNRDPRYLRNALRHRLLPAAVEVVGPSAAAQLARLAERAATDEELLESLARDLADGARDGDGLAVGTLCKAHPALQLRALGDLARSVAPDVRPGRGDRSARRGPAGAPRPASGRAEDRVTAGGGSRGCGAQRARDHPLACGRIDASRPAPRGAGTGGARPRRRDHSCLVRPGAVDKLPTRAQVGGRDPDEALRGAGFPQGERRAGGCGHCPRAEAELAGREC